MSNSHIDLSAIPSTLESSNLENNIEKCVNTKHTWIFKFGK